MSKGTQVTGGEQSPCRPGSGANAGKTAEVKESSRVSVRKFQKQSCPLAVHSQSHLTQKGAILERLMGPPGSPRSQR